ncbi:MAG TPA: hypothetical protein VL137_02795 [Polyangiaceae bacterium]|nr:hypothetical protein [Polyangiaceae bacterium]
MNNGRLWGSIATTLLGLCLSGCTVDEKCDALSACGGNVMLGADKDFVLNDGLVDAEYWAYRGDECQDELFTPPAQNTLLAQPTHLAREVPPERSSADWCQNLVIRSDRTIKRVNLWFPEIPLRDAKLTFSAPDQGSYMGSYQIQFNYSKAMRADFSKQCMEAQGVVFATQELRDSTGKILDHGCEEFSHAMSTVLKTEPNVSSVECHPGPQEGCSCIYNMLIVTGVTGAWRRKPDSSLMVLYDDLDTPPAPADYCAQASGELDMTGHDRTWLWNQQGLRTLKFKRSTCTDHKQNEGEGGVDCGGPCPNACP